MLGQSAQLVDLCCPSRGRALPDILENDVRRDRVELHVATGWEKREAVLDLRRQLLSAPAEQRAEATIEAKFLAVVANEIEHCAHRLAGTPSQPASKLLEKERWTVGGSQQ